jgi:hypothetical protein
MNDQLTIVTASDVGVFDFDVAAELAGLGDFEKFAFAEFGFNLAFDNENVARSDFTGERQTFADRQFAFFT